MEVVKESPMEVEATVVRYKVHQAWTGALVAMTFIICTTILICQFI